MVHAIVLLSHFHSLSSFVFSCGLTQDLDPISSQKYNKIQQKNNGNTSPPRRWGFHMRSNSNSSILGEQIIHLYIIIIMNYNFKIKMLSNKDIHDESMGKQFSTILGRQEVSVESLMQRMQNLSQKQDECSETELNYRFKTVEMQASATNKLFK